MPNTITSYTTFVAGTKARASEVNANFSNYRGTLVPINSDTASASDKTHDLGQPSHSWKDFYTQKVYVSDTTTGQSSYLGSDTAGNMHFSTPSIDGYKFNYDATTTEGLRFESNAPRIHGTGIGKVVWSDPGTSTWTTNFTNTSITFSSLSIELKGESVVKGGLRPGRLNSSGSSFVAFDVSPASNGSFSFALDIYRESTKIVRHQLELQRGVTLSQNKWPVSGFDFIDFSAASSATTVTYHFVLVNFFTSTAVSISHSNPYAYEL